MGGRRALVTGLGGFTGRYVAEALALAGYETFGIGNGPCRLPGYRQVELADRRGLARAVADIRPDAVIHLAAVAHVNECDADAYYRVNLIGTRNLLEALAENAAPDRVVLASSANVYGNATPDMLDEGTPPQPANDYAVSKLAMEYMARLWSERLPLTVTRPFNYTGVGQAETFLVPKIVAHARRGDARLELGNLDVERDFSDVRAVAQAYVRLLEAPAQGQTVNICSGRVHSLREIVALVEELAGRRFEIAVNPGLVRANEVRTLRGNPARLKGLIGDWDTPPLRETLAWMLAAPDA